MSEGCHWKFILASLLILGRTKIASERWALGARLFTTSRTSELNLLKAVRMTCPIRSLRLSSSSYVLSFVPGGSSAHFRPFRCYCQSDRQQSTLQQFAGFSSTSAGDV